MARNTISKSRIDCRLFASKNRIGAFKDFAKSFQENSAKKFQSGSPVLELIAERSDFVDELLTESWRYFVHPDDDDVALVAAGGYGRRELHPHSDIDIQVLLNDQNESPYENALADFFTFLWDIGLKPGQCVGTVKQCVDQAEADQSSLTRLLEARYIAGSKPLFDTMKTNIGPDYIWPSEKFFEAKMAEQAARYEKYDDTAYKLEPNVKEGPGGLRDIHVIAWTIKRHYNSPTLYELVKYDCLTESEYDEFMQAQKFLWRVRFALHCVTDRIEDRLLFDHQVAVAELLGYVDSKANKAVENFMQQYFRAVTRVESLNEMLLQLFREEFLREHEDCETLPISRQFQTLCHYIEVTHEKVFENNPLALLEIFLVLQQRPDIEGVHASTIRLIRQSLSLIDQDFRQNPQANNVFMEILRQPGGITHQLRRMNRYGVLAAYFPDFGRVVGRMQYDLFHIYTVDEHTLFVVRNLRRFALQKHAKEFPFCHDAFIRIDKPELLYIAGLLHDIGKGRGADHSKIGELIAKDFCSQHHLSKSETRIVMWLVRNHLIMSMTAQRKDIQDPKIIHDFVLHVGDQEMLNYLYLLTVADIRGTNPSLWNSWIDSLLKELYLESNRALRRGLHNPIAQQEKIKGLQQEARVLLKKAGLTLKQVKNVWRTISEDYFKRYSAEESVWHTIAIASCEPSDLPLVLLRPQNQRGTAEVFLYSKDTKSLFLCTTAVLDQLGLTTLNARIITTNHGYVLNSYQILEQSGDSIKDLQREHEICLKLREALIDPSGYKFRPGRRLNRSIKHFSIPTQVFFHPDPEDRYTVLEMHATDRPGLLTKVGKAFNSLRIRLYQAKITTIGSRAEDIFYVTDDQNEPLRCDDLKERLKEVVIEMVNEN